MTKRLEKNIDAESIRGFHEQDIIPLQEIVLALAIQPPNAMTVRDDIRWVHKILRITSYRGHRVVIEFDHYCWFQDLTYHILEKFIAFLV